MIDIIDVEIMDYDIDLDEMGRMKRVYNYGKIYR